MGHRPKCLLELAGEPLICRQVSALQTAGVASLVLVLGHHADRIDTALKDLTIKRVHNPMPEANPVSSLRLGLKALPPNLAGLLVVLADQPLIGVQDILDLVMAYQARPAGTHWVRPVVEGVPGNPVMFSDQVRLQILTSHSLVGGPQWAQAHPEQVHAWVTTNRHYLTDVDTMDDVRALTALTGLKLNWPDDLKRASDPHHIETHSFDNSPRPENSP